MSTNYSNKRVQLAPKPRPGSRSRNRPNANRNPLPAGAPSQGRTLGPQASRVGTSRPVNPQRIVSGRVEPTTPISTEIEVARASSDVGNIVFEELLPPPSRRVKKSTGGETAKNIDASDKKSQTNFEEVPLKSTKSSMQIFTPEPSSSTKQKIIKKRKVESLVLAKHGQDSNSQVCGFDLSEHFSCGEETVKSDILQDFTFGYGNRMLDENKLLNVNNFITFSSYYPIDVLTRSDRATNKDCGCFKAFIKIENKSEVNVTYCVKTSSMSTFRIHPSIGFLYPKSSKDVLITTNPKHHYKFEDVVHAYFQVQAYPVLFRPQLKAHRIDALWRAVDSQLIPVQEIELHQIKYVYPENDALLHNYSLLDRISLELNMQGNSAEIEYFALPTISAKKFHSIWNFDPEQESALMKFKNQLYVRALIRLEMHYDVEIKQFRKISATFGLILMSYLFAGILLFRTPLPEPPKPDMWTTACNFFSEPKLMFVGLWDTLANGVYYVCENVSSFAASSFNGFIGWFHK